MPEHCGREIVASGVQTPCCADIPGALNGDGGSFVPRTPGSARCRRAWRRWRRCVCGRGVTRRDCDRSRPEHLGVHNRFGRSLVLHGLVDHRRAIELAHRWGCDAGVSLSETMASHPEVDTSAGHTFLCQARNCRHNTESVQPRGRATRAIRFQRSARRWRRLLLLRDEEQRAGAALAPPRRLPGAKRDDAEGRQCRIGRSGAPRAGWYHLAQSRSPLVR